MWEEGDVIADFMITDADVDGGLGHGFIQRKRLRW